MISSSTVESLCDSQYIPTVQVLLQPRGASSQGNVIGAASQTGTLSGEHDDSRYNP